MTSFPLACGPSLDNLLPFLIIAALGLTAVKFLIYAGFITAFRYRVSTPLPMPRSRVWKLAAVRLGIGLLVVGGTWLCFFFSPIRDESAIHAIWLIAAGERLAVWFILGRFMAHLAGRRLVGWTLSGTAIDLVSDAALYYTGRFGLGAPIIAVGAILVFITALYFVGRRGSLLLRFARSHICHTCGYDLTGNVSGVCPECGKPVAQPSPQSAPS